MEPCGRPVRTGRFAQVGLNTDIDPLMTYRRFPAEFPNTSTPNLVEVEEKFDQIHEEGYEKVIAICISSGLSGTCNTIRLAAEDYDKMQIFVFDTKNVSVGCRVRCLCHLGGLEGFQRRFL